MAGTHKTITKLCGLCNKEYTTRANAPTTYCSRFCSNSTRTLPLDIKKQRERERRALYYSRNKARLAVSSKESKKRYKLKNREGYLAWARASVAKRKAYKIQRIPKWITSKELKEISLFYKNCPKGYHVDHIIPLKGNIVSGLHVLNNLQYLTASENCRKHNKF